jgi:hypothetical protein
MMDSNCIARLPVADAADAIATVLLDRVEALINAETRLRYRYTGLRSEVSFLQTFSMDDPWIMQYRFPHS